jgi:hypothetical protein
LEVAWPLDQVVTLAGSFIILVPTTPVLGFRG